MLAKTDAGPGAGRSTDFGPARGSVRGGSPIRGVWRSLPALCDDGRFVLASPQGRSGAVDAASSGNGEQGARGSASPSAATTRPCWSPRPASSRVSRVDADIRAVRGPGRREGHPARRRAGEHRQGAPARAWVLNALDNSVSVVDLSDPAAPAVQAAIALADRTVKRGRIAFNSAEASSTGTFACASCHPDGHTDQLLWVLDTPLCDVGCTRSSRGSSRTSAACAAAPPTTGTAFPATPSAASTPPTSGPPSSPTAPARSRELHRAPRRRLAGHDDVRPERLRDPTTRASPARCCGWRRRPRRGRPCFPLVGYRDEDFSDHR